MVALANSQSQYIWNSKRSEQKSISRHAQPSGPWPWLDASTILGEEHMKTDDKSAEWRPAEWIKYPRSCFPNWMDNQVKSSGIGAFIQDAGSSCTVHRAEVDGKGSLPDGDDLEVTNDTDDFLRSNLRFFMREKGTNLGNKQDKTEPAGDSQGKGTPIEALFIRNLSGEVLKWLGHHYKIEPFFFSSAINRTASHFQEDRIEVDGAYHITIVLPFVRCEAWDPAKRKLFSAPSTASLDTVAEQKIDTYAPLLLGSNKKVLFPDLLAVHLVRNDNGHTMISYHPKDDDSKNNEAKHLRDRVILAGRSVYWRHIFPQDRRDPNYWLLILLWFVLYAWDESLDELYSHICYLEFQAIDPDSDWRKITDQLHVIQAHLLHYISLLEDFQKTVDFVLAAHKNVLPKGTSVEDTAMAPECQTLKDEVGRLQSLRNVQESRLKNVMKLLFSQVNITENSQTKSLAETSSRDSAAMKQIAYLTMVFLPSSFVASIFGMNVKEISPDTLGALRTFFAIAVPLTLTTVWVIVAIQSHYMFEGEKDPPFRKRLIWPYFRLKRAYHKRKLRRQIRQRDIEEGHDRCGTEEDDTTLKEGEQK